MRNLLLFFASSLKLSVPARPYDYADDDVDVDDDDVLCSSKKPAALSKPHIEITMKLHRKVCF